MCKFLCGHVFIFIKYIPICRSDEIGGYCQFVFQHDYIILHSREVCERFKSVSLPTPVGFFLVFVFAFCFLK